MKINEITKMNDISSRIYQQQSEWFASDSIDAYMDSFEEVQNTDIKIKGYELKIAKKDYRVIFALAENGISLGYLEIEKQLSNIWCVVGIFMQPQLRGKNLAIELYVAAITQFGYTIVSSGFQTSGSKKIWLELSERPELNVYKWNKKPPRGYSIAYPEYEIFEPEYDDESEIWWDHDNMSDIRQVMKDDILAADKLLRNGQISHAKFLQMKDNINHEYEQLRDELEVTYDRDVRLIAIGK